MINTPLVSCVMPTADRAEYIPLAIHCFLAQTFTASELVILDDGKEPERALIPEHERIRYVRLEHKHILGVKRNLLCELAHADVICHWDSDDWYSPLRLADQYARLMGSIRSVTGYHRFYYWNECNRRAYEYVYTGAGHYASGSTQCYRKAYWKKHPFEPIQTAEDSNFSFAASNLNELTSVPAGNLMVARGHGRNTWKQPFGQRGFPVVDRMRLPPEFFRDMGNCAPGSTDSHQNGSNYNMLKRVMVGNPASALEQSKAAQARLIQRPIPPAPAATPEVLPVANPAAPGTPFEGSGIVNTTMETLENLKPVVNPPAPPAQTVPTFYPTPGAAGAACSPAIAGPALDYVTWDIATRESLPGTCEACLEAATTQAAYQAYLDKWAIMQKIRQQGGGAVLDQVLASMASI